MLYAVFPDRGYFELSPTVRVTVEDDGFTWVKLDKKGRDQFLILNPVLAARVKEALVQLSSQPPSRIKVK